MASGLLAPLCAFRTFVPIALWEGNGGYPVGDIPWSLGLEGLWVGEVLDYCTFTQKPISSPPLNDW